MNLKNFLTLLGGILSALGPTLITAADNSTAWWIGRCCTVVGPVLLGARSLFDGDKKPDDKP